MLVQLVFPQANELFRKLPQVGHALSKIFVSHVKGRKISKNIGLRGSKFLACPVSPYVSGRA